MSSRSLANRIWYRLLQLICRLIAVLVFRFRVGGRHHLPESGGVLLLCNHQSHLDPVLVGIGCNRRLNYLARETLFNFPQLGWLIRSLDAIPIDRDGLGMSGLKETLRRLKRGEIVLVFPEGTRSGDGQLKPLRPGFSAIAQRAGAFLVPVAIDGAYDAWPRQRKFPRSAVIRVEFGLPLAPAEAKSMSDRELVELIHGRIAECLTRARANRERHGP